jgi:O-antigen ligase
VSLKSPRSPLPIAKHSAGAATQHAEVGYYLVLLALLFEFGRPQDFLPFLKVIPFATLFDGALAAAVLLSRRANLLKPQTRLWIGLLILMASWVPFANNNFWALMIVKDMTLYFFVYLGVITFINTTRRVQFLFKIWLAIHAVLAVNGILHQGQGIGGWLGDENDFGMEMNVAVPFAFFLFQGATSKRDKALYLGLLGLFVLSTIATSSRGGFIGLLVVGAFCWWYSPQKIRSVALIVCVVSLILIAAPAEYWDRVRTITDESTIETGTAGQRMFSWGIGWEMFLANPILGVGQGNFPWTIGEYLGGRTWQTKSLAGRQAHSLYFTLLPELGLMGGIVFGSIVYLNYKDLRYSVRLWRQRHAIRSQSRDQEDRDIERIAWFSNAILGAFIGYLITSIFISTLYYPTFWILTALTVALRSTTQQYSEVKSRVSILETRARLRYRARPPLTT